MGGNFHTHDWHVEALDLESEARESTKAARRGEVGGIRVVRMLEMGKGEKTSIKPTGPAKAGIGAGGAGGGIGAGGAGRGIGGSGVQRQREPRENAEFLRICVLEMNMRRAGKLEPEIPGAGAGAGGSGGGIMAARTGRRAFWLPPRQMGRVDGSARGREKERGRWVGVCA